MSYDDFDYRFRYLNSDQYACVLTVMDSEGGLHESGSVSRYYTEEEKRQQESRKKYEDAKQEELFGMLEGTWTSEDGESFECNGKVFNKVNHTSSMGNLIYYV